MTETTIVAPEMVYPENVKAFFEDIHTVYEDRLNGRLLARGKDKMVKRVMEGIYDQHCRCFVDFLYRYFLVGSNDLDSNSGTYLWVRGLNTVPASTTFDWGPGIHHPFDVPPAPAGIMHRKIRNHRGDTRLDVLWPPVFALPVVIDYEVESRAYATSHEKKTRGFGQSRGIIPAHFNVSSTVSESDYVDIRIRARNMFGLGEWSEIYQIVGATTKPLEE